MYQLRIHNRNSLKWKIINKELKKCANIIGSGGDFLPVLIGVWKNRVFMLYYVWWTLYS